MYVYIYNSRAELQGLKLKFHLCWDVANVSKRQPLDNWSRFQGAGSGRTIAMSVFHLTKHGYGSIPIDTFLVG